MAANCSDVIVVGGGLSGLITADKLRDRDVLVLESRQRVGGRTLSRKFGEQWYNVGAQFVWDPRTLETCESLGLEVLSAHGGRPSIAVGGSYVEASNPLELLYRLPTPIADRVELATVVARMRWLSFRSERARRAKTGSSFAEELDQRGLGDVMHSRRPLSKQVFDQLSEGATGLSAADVSGWIGLSYCIHMFGGDPFETLKQIVGGTQALSKALAERVGSERVQLGAKVVNVENEGDNVVVTYIVDGTTVQKRARTCIIAAPADTVLEVVPALGAEKRRALEAVCPYADLLLTAWSFRGDEQLPWDGTVSTPVLGDPAIELLANNSFFAQQAPGWAEKVRGNRVLVATSTCERLEHLAGLSDEEAQEVVGKSLRRIFPEVDFDRRLAGVEVKRWKAYPAFRRGWLASRDALRAPVGRIFFSGDYTAQPGTAGAVGSGWYAAKEVEHILGGRREGARVNARDFERTAI